LHLLRPRGPLLASCRCLLVVVAAACVSLHCRDLKPENLLYKDTTDSSLIKIADFGL